MKLLEFVIDTIQLAQNKISLSDTLRAALYQENDVLFNLLDYEDDFAFLEPTLISYFLSDVSQTEKIELYQCLLGYIPKEKRPHFIRVKADKFGLINLPKLGYLRSNPGQISTIDTLQLQEQIISNTLIENSEIRLCLHPTDHLALIDNVEFNESTEISLYNHINQIVDATVFFKKSLPEFWQLIESVTREFVIFSSPNHNSFAGIGQQGTAYFNIENKQKTSIFFVDDIAHQCGHIIFNLLTLDTETYLQVPKDYPLAEFSDIQGDVRDVYGAFHGLFTYTTILHSLDTLLKSELLFDKVLRHEVRGRIGFYMNKFNFDLHLMNNANILTEFGMNYHQQFANSFDIINQEYGKSIALLDYSNQPYTFQYDLFTQLNPLAL